MRIDNYQFPKSSFLSIDKDLNLIISKLLKNQRFKKLLYYPTTDCLNLPNLTDKESVELFGKNIRIVPKIDIDPGVQSYVNICFDGFIPNATNPEFRDNTIIFDIYCNYDVWQMEDFQLRPYRIAGEIDSMLNGKHLTGIGDLEFVSANFIGVGQDYGGIMLIYRAVHGGEDKKGMPNPIDEAQFIEDFNEMYDQ